MLNMVQLIGYTGKNPEIRSTQSGDKVASFSLATSEKWKSRDGERQERTEWHNVVVWGKLAEIVEKYVEKGTLLYVAGKIQTRKWQDKDGAERRTTEIVLSGYDAKLQMLGGKGNGGGDRRGDDEDEAPRSSSTRDRASARKQEPPADELDDDIPF